MACYGDPRVKLAKDSLEADRLLEAARLEREATRKKYGATVSRKKHGGFQGR